MNRRATMFNRAFVVSIVLVVLFWNAEAGQCLQIPADELIRRLESTKSEPNDSGTQFEYVANFTSAWIDSHELDDAHRRMFNEIARQLRRELELVPSCPPREISTRIHLLVRKELARGKTPKVVFENQNQRQRLVAEWNNYLKRQEIYERIYVDQFQKDESEPIALSAGAQEKRIIEIFESLEASDPMVAQFHSDFFMFELGTFGPNALFRNPLFRKQMHWSPEQADAIIFGFDFEAYETAEIAPKKRLAMADFLQTLTESQRELLARKLGVSSPALPQLADITPALDLKGVFSESIGKLPVNHHGRERLLLSTKSALGGLRRYVASNGTEASIAIDGMHEVSKNLNAFPPGELGDISDLVAEFNAELTQLPSDVPDELRTEVSRLIGELEGYQNDSATPWKWTGVVDLKIQTSLGELADEQMDNDVPLNMKRAFSNISTHRSLVADPSERLLQNVQIIIGNQNLDLPAQQHIEIFNAQVDHPQVHEFENTAHRLAETKAQMDLIINRLIPRQSAKLSAGYAQHLFFEYGPYNYFQRPDFAAEFKITPEQHQKMDETAKRISENIERQIHPQVMKGVMKLFESLSVDERLSVEKLLDCKLSELAESLLIVRGERVLREMMITPFGPFFESRRLLPENEMNDEVESSRPRRRTPRGSPPPSLPTPIRRPQSSFITAQRDLVTV